MRSFAGDIEPGDKILSGQVLTASTDRYGGFAAQQVQRDMTVVAVVPSEFGTERVLVSCTGVTFDLHRTKVVKVVEA